MKHHQWDRIQAPAICMKAMALRSEDTQNYRSSDRASPSSQTQPRSTAGSRARSRTAAQTAGLTPGTEAVPRGFKPYEANVSECNSEGRVAVGHGRRPKAL